MELKDGLALGVGGSECREDMRTLGEKLSGSRNGTGHHRAVDYAITMNNNGPKQYSDRCVTDASSRKERGSIFDKTKENATPTDKSFGQQKDDDEDDYDQPDETEVDADDRHVLWSHAKNGAGAGDWPLKG
ncbi:GM11067 [Drosophila sechellia]|uniref:GM11067 n=1 Tax=Drosophila sechellia TaxID=7238 RepID=B4HX50_DROSE|nr:GM11067 [Drosophila sechellia]